MHHFGHLVENEIFWGGLYENAWEAMSLKYWTLLCKDANCIFDAGANTGIYSLVAREVNQDASVIAFEPLKRIFAMLQKNKELNSFEIMCVEKALSNADGDAIIYDDFSSDHSYDATVGVNLRLENSKVVGGAITTIKLETFINEQKIKKIDLIKIDVEKHEPELLEGFGKYLALFAPTMLIEILSDDIAVRIQNLIKDIPYVYFNINESSGLRRVENLSKSDGYNFLICKIEVAQKLGLMV